MKGNLRKDVTIKRNEAKAWVPPQECADYFSISIDTVRRLHQSGEIPVLFVKGLPRFNLGDVEAALMERGLGSSRTRTRKAKKDRHGAK